MSNKRVTKLRWGSSARKRNLHKKPGFDQHNKPEFSRFEQLPVEIQQQIFTQALRKPNIHAIVVGRADYDAAGTWSLSFSPVIKKSDKSGFRMLENISSVNEVASTAVRLAAQKNEQGQQAGFSRLPFKLLKNRIDSTEDLVLLDIPCEKGVCSAMDYFHPQRQFLNATGRCFDGDDLATRCKDIQKVALTYHGQDPHCKTRFSNFRCLGHPPHAFIQRHRGPMCPEEVCGLLNSFPNLREFYIIFVPNSNDPSDHCHRTIDRYIKDYYSLPADSPIRRSLAAFHAADHSYIEFHDDPNGCWNGDEKKFEPKPWHYGVNHLSDLRILLRELKEDYFLADTKPHLLQHERDEIAAMFRRSLPERKALVFKVLIVVPDDEKVG